MWFWDAHTPLTCGFAGHKRVNSITRTVDRAVATAAAGVVPNRRGFRTYESRFMSSTS